MTNKHKGGHIKKDFTKRIPDLPDTCGIWYYGQRLPLLILVPLVSPRTLRYKQVL